MRIGVIGAGRMGSALIEGLLRAGTKPEDILINDKRAERVQYWRERGVREAPKGEIAKCDIVFLAVKPKEVQEVLEEFPLDYRGVLVSLAAGVKTETFSRLKGARVFRIMPNILCSVGEGAIALAGPSENQEVKDLLSKLGLVVEVPEELLDAVTALSGSGPAFFASLLDWAVEESTRLGLEREIALKLAAQTLKGLGTKLLEEPDPQSVIQSVTSPGGTTQAGLAVLVQAKEIVQRTIRAAFDRARELCSGK